MNELSAADIMALTQNKDDGAGGIAGIWNNPFIYFVWMMFMRWFNGNGNGEANGNALTQAELFDGLGRQDIVGNQRSILDRLDLIGSGLNEGLGNVRYDNLQNVNAVQAQLVNGFNGVNAGLAENRFASQQCCCNLGSKIDALAAENFKNTCEITSAIHAEGEATRDLIQQNTVQALRDKLADKDRELMVSNIFNGQQAQTQAIVGQIKPCPIPAYMVSSPYQTVNYCGCGI